MVAQQHLCVWGSGCVCGGGGCMKRRILQSFRGMHDLKQKICVPYYKGLHLFHVAIGLPCLPHFSDMLRWDWSTTVKWWLVLGIVFMSSGPGGLRAGQYGVSYWVVIFEWPIIEGVAMWTWDWWRATCHLRYGPSQGLGNQIEAHNLFHLLGKGSDRKGGGRLKE